MIQRIMIVAIAALAEPQLLPFWLVVAIAALAGAAASAHQLESDPQ
jgi:hypothetical protein